MRGQVFFWPLFACIFSSLSTIKPCEVHLQETLHHRRRKTLNTGSNQENIPLLKNVNWDVEHHLKQYYQNINMAGEHSTSAI